MRPHASTPTATSIRVRCAIYTRKCTEEGLQQEFNTLDAQCESAEAFIAAQKHEGWICLPDRYDDSPAAGRGRADAGGRPGRARSRVGGEPVGGRRDGRRR